jgi:ABC-2 type transport system ATP-binding protein
MPQNQAVSCIDLCKSFGALTAVDHFSLDIFQGEILGFLGPNGAGKSTTINMICGLLQPNHGQVLIDGEELKTHPVNRIKIGVCPQNNIFWSRLTGLEQLIFMARMYGINRSDARHRALSLLDQLGLSQKASARSGKWSGGMKRRLNIALALIHQPEILILDEPETGLDPQSRVMVREMIKSLVPEMTVILTTHNMDEADRMADRVAVIDVGRLIALGTPKELKDSIGGKDEIREVIVREKTLEDVFIHLTGKNLRS